MSDDLRPQDRLRERAADVALQGDAFSLEEIELALQLGIDLERETEELELAAAALAVAQLGRFAPLAEPVAPAADAGDAMPAHLKARIAATAAAVIAPDPIRIHETPGRAEASARAAATAASRAPFGARDSMAPFRARDSMAPFRARDWMLAAASIALGAVATVIVLNAGTAGDGFTRDPAAFVRTHPRAVHWPWQGTDDPHVVGAVRGEAYFDPDSEDGLLEIEGLAPNDPAVEQYQLWIFDAARDERYPVDGGVFDVRSRGRVVIPVKARVDVSTPIQFAVTVERPGGAVVSERRIALLAKP